MEIDGFYPVVVRESRYMGTYSGGTWVLMAGCHAPEQTEAFGGDVPCGNFWIDVEQNGPVVEVSGPHGTKDVYVASGGDPNQLIEDAREYLSNNE